MIDKHNLPNAIPNERVVYFLRRHPIVLVGLTLGVLLFMAMPVLVITALTTFQPELLASQAIRATIVMGGSIFMLFSWLFLFQNYVDYFLDMWIVTDKRVLNIEQTGLFGRTVSELRLYRIQDVTASVHGILHTVFDFGHVEIQTAGENLRFQFEEVPHPNTVAKKILELSECDRRQKMDTGMEDLSVPSRPNPHPVTHNP